MELCTDVLHVVAVVLYHTDWLVKPTVLEGRVLQWGFLGGVVSGELPFRCCILLFG